MPAWTSSWERWLISKRVRAVSATLWMEATICSMDEDVSATLEVCICVLFTTFCTLMLISCMVLVTSSIAVAASTPTFADSVDAAAIWLDPEATPAALSLTCVARSRSP